MKMLSVERLTVLSDKRKVLKNISFSISPGEVAGIVGPNGSGKTTLAKAIAGILPPDMQILSGKIVYNGENITFLSPEERVRKGIVYVFQRHPKFVTITLEDIADSRWIKELELEDYRSSPLFCSVSEGEKKREDLAAALSLNPKLLILDEIDSGVDIDSLKIIGRAIRKYREENPECSLIVISHHFQIFDYIFPDKVLVIKNGSVVYRGCYAIIMKIRKEGYNLW